MALSPETTYEMQSLETAYKIVFKNPALDGVGKQVPPQFGIVGETTTVSIFLGMHRNSQSYSAK